MTTTTVQKGAVISIRSLEDANIIVLHKDGTINTDCISVARLNDEKHYHYILQDGDIVVRENKSDKTSQRHISIESVTINIVGDRVRATYMDMCATPELKDEAIRLLNDQSQRSLNFQTSQTLINTPEIGNLITHGVLPVVQGHAIDFLVDAPGILFEKLDKGEHPSSRGNAIQSLAYMKEGKVVHDTFIDMNALNGTSYSGTEHSLLITRSLRHAMRLTVSTHSQDDLEATQQWFEKVIVDAGFQIRKTKTKRGELFIVLPKLSKRAIELCKLVG